MITVLLWSISRQPAAANHFEGRSVHVFHMSDGKLTEFWAFPEDQSMFDDFWT
ncbi:MAG: hypothetical protein IH943_08065 [Acidobacteria bacterium]|jgi:hypothetical protein|nr:hypothetical protein [Acidobacteriota bacterium]